jgi:RNA polymerase sigma factor for flagellar operon FliA
LNLREIGQVLDVSESRVSQIHSQAMHRLKARMQSWQS